MGFAQAGNERFSARTRFETEAQGLGSGVLCCSSVE